MFIICHDDANNTNFVILLSFSLSAKNGIVLFMSLTFWTNKTKHN